MQELGLINIQCLYIINPMDTIKGEKIKINDETYDYSGDFKILTKDERQGIVKTARNLLKVQQENAVMFADVLPLQNEG